MMAAFASLRREKWALIQAAVLDKAQSAKAAEKRYLRHLILENHSCPHQFAHGR